MRWRRKNKSAGTGLSCGWVLTDILRDLSIPLRSATAAPLERATDWWGFAKIDEVVPATLRALSSAG
jgi:hypothetical protein